MAKMIVYGEEARKKLQSGMLDALGFTRFFERLHRLTSFLLCVKFNL